MNSELRQVDRQLSTVNARLRRFWGPMWGVFSHAFAVGGEGDQLAADDVAFLDRFARLLADRGLAGPAVFFVESLSPLGFLGSQLVHALIPIMGMVAAQDDIERLARLLERRETPGLFADRLRWFDTLLRQGSEQASLDRARDRLRPGSGQAHHGREGEGHRG